MKTLLSTTAVAFALAMSNVAVASTTFVQTETTSEISIILQPMVPDALFVGLEGFFRGDFDCGSGTTLASLKSEDMYTGMGSSLVPTVRNIT